MNSMSPDSTLDSDRGVFESISRRRCSEHALRAASRESLRCCRRSAASAKVLDPQRLMDLHRRQRPLSRGDRQLLIPARGIADDVHARDIGRLVIPGHHGALRGELAAKESGQVRSLLLTGREEERRALQWRTSFELDAFEPPAATNQPADRLLTNGDAVTFASRACVATEAPAVRHEDHVVAPREKDQRRIDPTPTPTVCGERTVRVLEGVTERTVMDAPTLEGLESGDVRELVCNSGRKQQPSTVECPAVVAPDGERATPAADGGDRTGAELNGRVSRQFGAAEIKELRRRRAVSGQEAVRRSRGAITRLPIVDDDHPPSTASEHQRGGESCWSGADDRDVVITHASHTSTFSAADIYGRFDLARKREAGGRPWRNDGR